MATLLPSSTLLCASIAVIFLGLQSNSKSVRPINLHTIQDILETKCRNKSQTQTYTYIQQGIKSIGNCVTQKIPTGNPKDAFCTESRLGLHSCYGNILGNFELCMDYKEKYLPKFIFDILDVTLDNICLHKNNATEFTRDIKLFQATTNALVQQDLLNNCVSRFRVFWEIGEPVPLLEKKVMCEGLEKLGECLVFVSKQKGDAFQSITDYINAIFYKYLKLCENHLPIND